MRKLLAVCLLSAGFALGAVACKSDSTIAAHLAVSYATAKYIEKGGAGAPARAQRVIDVADAIEAAATGESVTIAALKALVLAKLPGSLSPADRVLANALIDAVLAELEARIGDGVLKPDQLVKVREVLKWVREGASQFVPPPVSA